jgi:uncharacterized protein (DUF2141 family)
VTARAWIRRWACWSGSVGVLLFLGCAKSVSPPGGPIDRTPPKVMSSLPPSGSTHLPLDSRIVIQFSEAMESRNPGQTVFLSPQTDPPPKLSVKGDRLEIRFPGGLKADKTYIVTLGADLKDAHAVGLAQSVSLAFATGATIDSGSIAGIVYDQGKPKGGISLALFENAPDGTLPIDSLVPDYLTQSGKDGAFAFRYLPPKPYYLIAFDDQSKNRRINLSREKIGIPFKSTTIDTGRISLAGIDVQMVLRESGEVGLKSVTMNPDHLVKTRFGRKLSQSQAKTLFESASIREAGGDSLPLGLAAFAPITPYPSSDFLLLTEEPALGKAYRIQFDQKTLYPAVADSLRYLCGDFSAAEGTDAAPPTILEQSPADKTTGRIVDSLIRFRFSEPLDSARLERAVRVADSLGDTLSVPLTAIDRFTWSGRPTAPLIGGRGYTVLVDGTAVRDRAGNRLSDSTLKTTFVTMDPAAWGQVSGDIRMISISDTLAPVVVAFVPAGQGTRRETTIPAGTRHYLVDLAPGYYTIDAFVDVDGDGTYGAGTIAPFHPAEPFTAPPDTVRVRSRFESAGIAIGF